MVNIVVNTEVETYMTRQPDPDYSWDSGDSAGYVSNVWASVDHHDNSVGNWGDSLVKEFPNHVGPGTTLYAVVADYESGSTFGRCGGYADVLDVFLDKAKAEELAAVAMSDAGDRYSFMVGEKMYHRSWVGYFEDLQSLDIWEIKVRPESQSFLTPVGERSYGYKTGT